MIAARMCVPVRPGSLLLCALVLVVATSPDAAAQPIPLDTLRAGTASRLLAGAAAATRSVDVLDREAILALPARTLADVVSRALGVDLLARSAAQADVSIRGSSFEQILVMVDGVPVNDDQTGHFHLDAAVPLDAIERVEVLRGPASALFGSSAVGGVINIVTRRGVRELAARVQGGSSGSVALALDAAAAAGPLQLHASAEHDRSDGHRVGTDHRITQARLALDAPVARGALRADAGYARRDFGANAFYAPFDSYEETRTAEGALSWRSAPARWTIEPRVSFRQHDDDFVLRRDDPAFYRNVHTSRLAGAELVARWNASPAARVAFGVDAAHSALESTNLGDRDENRAAAFLELAAGDVVRTLITTGIRLDRHSTFGTFLSPSIAAGLRISDRARIRASAGGGFRAPTWTERYYVDPANVGNPDLAAERFWTGELGTQLTLSPRTRLDVAVFVRRADDLIDWGRPAGAGPEAPWRTMNIETATFRGAETALQSTVVGVGINARAALLGYRAEEAGGTVSKYALRPLTRSLAIELTTPVADVLNVAVRGAHYARAAADPSATADSWTLADARASANWRSLTLFADVTNVTDTSYHDVTGERAPGRAFSIGARVHR